MADEPKPTEEQAQAIGELHDFLASGNSDEHTLEGPAGTGKTFVMKDFVSGLKGKILFTATTNKATKVLRNALTSEDYKPECRTIFSALGLRLEANGEVKALAEPEDPVDLSQYSCIVVDEASMEGKALRIPIKAEARGGLPFIHMGDPAQLFPVKEGLSEVWRLESKSKLSTVMRHGGEILGFCNKVRAMVDHPAPCIRLQAANDGETGVWRDSAAQANASIIQAAEEGQFSDASRVKVIAWRNATVDRFNLLIRQHIFGPAASAQWLVGDRLILTSPAKDLESGRPIAHTDDEGVVERAEEAPHPLYPEYLCWRLVVALDENKTITLWAAHESSAVALERRVGELAEVARTLRQWKGFWDFKEAFHSCRHAYALTAHRAQGSTYQRVFVDASDILVNRSRNEAFRCLYVAASRAKHQLHLI